MTPDSPDHTVVDHRQFQSGSACVHGRVAATTSEFFGVRKPNPIMRRPPDSMHGSTLRCPWVDAYQPLRHSARSSFHRGIATYSFRHPWVSD